MTVDSRQDQRHLPEVPKLSLLENAVLESAVSYRVCQLAFRVVIGQIDSVKASNSPEADAYDDARRTLDHNIDSLIEARREAMLQHGPTIERCDLCGEMHEVQRVIAGGVSHATCPNLPEGYQVPMEQGPDGKTRIAFSRSCDSCTRGEKIEVYQTSTGMVPVHHPSMMVCQNRVDPELIGNARAALQRRIESISSPTGAMSTETIKAIAPKLIDQGR